MSYIRQHLQERHVDLSHTRVIVSDETNKATFLLFNLIGQFVGYQRYNPLGDKKLHNNEDLAKYYTYVGSDHAYGLWGMETVKPEDEFIFITEGIFDAIRIHNLNLPALAVLSCSPSPAVKQQLRLLGKRIIAILDNDSSGNRLSHIGHESYMVPDPYKDLGEMPNALVEQFILELV